MGDKTRNTWQATTLVHTAINNTKYTLRYHRQEYTEDVLGRQCSVHSSYTVGNNTPFSTRINLLQSNEWTGVNGSRNGDGPIQLKWVLSHHNASSSDMVLTAGETEAQGQRR